MKLKNFDYVLALANKPPGAQSISDWRPFGTDTLDQIIEKHNDECIKELQTISWPANYIEEFGRFIAAVDYDLSEVSNIDLARFQKINVLFADLNAVDGATDAVELVKGFMNQARHQYYLVQTSEKRNVLSQRQRFTPSPVVPSSPEIIYDDATLQVWLAKLCTYYGTAIAAVLPPPPPDGPGPSDSGGSGGPGGGGDSGDHREPEGDTPVGSWKPIFVSYRPPVSLFGSNSVVDWGFERSLVDIAVEVRDAAIQKEFTMEQTKVLAQKAVLQEMVLGHVRSSVLDYLDLSDDHNLVLDCLRKPLDEIAPDDNYVAGKGEIEVLAVKLARPLRGLSKRESDACSLLSLNRKNDRVILASQQKTFEILERLNQVVETRSVQVTLPFNAGDLLLK